MPANAERELLSLAKECGLTPASRGRLGLVIEQEEEVDDDERPSSTRGAKAAMRTVLRTHGSNVHPRSRVTITLGIGKEFCLRLS